MVPISQVIAALADSKPGEVLVIDTQDSTRTVGGELFATESQRRGLAGLLIDGPVSVEALRCVQPITIVCTAEAAANDLRYWVIVPRHGSDRGYDHSSVVHVDPANIWHRKQDLRDAGASLLWRSGSRPRRLGVWRCGWNHCGLTHRN